MKRRLNFRTTECCVVRDGNQMLEVMMMMRSWLRYRFHRELGNDQQEAEDEESESTKVVMKKIQPPKQHDSRLAARIVKMSV
jgi:hypothetical protein